MWYIDAPECLLCLLESRYAELKKLNVKDPAMYMELGRYVMENAGRGRVAVFIESHVWLRRRLGIDDPHNDEKASLESLAKDAISNLLSDLGDDVVRYVELAAAANSVDIPMRGYRFSTEDLLARLNDEVRWLGITRDGLREIIARAGSIGYVVDNAGEFQFDKALIKRLAELGREVVVYARSEPYEVDVTEEYVINELHGLSNVKVVGSGNAYSALAKKDLWPSLGSHDLLIMKGLDNFETYLELKPRLGNALFLLRAKCPLIARLLGVPTNSPVIVSRDYVDEIRIQ